MCGPACLVARIPAVKSVVMILFLSWTQAPGCGCCARMVERPRMCGRAERDVLHIRSFTIPERESRAKRGARCPRGPLGAAARLCDSADEALACALSALPPSGP